MRIINLTKKTWLATRVNRADSFRARLVGLLGKTDLKAEEALWLAPAKGIHTIGMKFPIDVIFLNGDNRVVRAISDLAPYRLTRVYLTARSVLELRHGTIKKSQTEAGDLLGISMVCEGDGAIGERGQR